MQPQTGGKQGGDWLTTQAHIGNGKREEERCYPVYDIKINQSVDSLSF